MALDHEGANRSSRPAIENYDAAVSEDVSTRPDMDMALGVPESEENTQAAGEDRGDDESGDPKAGGRTRGGRLCDGGHRWLSVREDCEPIRSKVADARRQETRWLVVRGRSETVPLL
jgi:hypothetical protein